MSVIYWHKNVGNCQVLVDTNWLVHCGVCVEFKSRGYGGRCPRHRELWGAFYAYVMLRENSGLRAERTAWDLSLLLPPGGSSAVGLGAATSGSSSGPGAGSRCQGLDEKY
jgi:hypothetical protein